MSDLFGIINLGLSALTAHRTAVDVTSHNLANANTPGYSRQEALLATNPPLPPAGTAAAIVGGQTGTGVHVQAVRRAQEAFLALQSRTFRSELGRWSAAAPPLKEVESVLSPAPGTDLSALLDRFWDAWDTVANAPEDLGLRETLLGTAATLVDSFREASQRLQTIRLTTDVGITSRINEVNTLARQVAELNRQIQVALAEGRSPNDLLDSREIALDRLAELCGAMPFLSEGGHLIIYLDGRPLVQGSAAFSLSVTTGSQGVQITTSYDGQPVRVSNGEIGGLLQARDAAIPAYLQRLDAVASALVSQVNALHEAGYGLDGNTGVSFFVGGTTAGDIALDPAVAADGRAIAASASGAPGDGSVALRIANLRTRPVLGGRTLSEAAQDLFGALGEDIAACDDRADSQQTALDQLQQQQQSVSGVSIDEELVYLTLSQRAYEAAARIITAADEMLATIIERMAA